MTTWKLIDATGRLASAEKALCVPSFIAGTGRTPASHLAVSPGSYSRHLPLESPAAGSCSLHFTPAWQELQAASQPAGGHMFAASRLFRVSEPFHQIPCLIGTRLHVGDEKHHQDHQGEISSPLSEEATKNIVPAAGQASSSMFAILLCCSHRAFILTSSQPAWLQPGQLAGSLNSRTSFSWRSSI